jgi:DNA-binding NtrC family response regulator
MSAAAPSVLIVDDDDTFRNVLARELVAAGLNVNSRSRGEEVEEALLEVTYDVVVLDLKMTGMDGIATLGRIKAVRPLTEVIILTGHGSLEGAVQALKLGAHDFLTKPCDLDHLESVIRRAARARAMRSENAALRQALSRRGNDAELVGHSKAMEQVKALIEKVAPTGSTVLIQGETGTGKEIIARAIHQLSDRRQRPFVVLDCGATEESLALSELFGHEQGAYTGATSRKHGLFELADFGTILVDEVGDAPMSLQTRLLRVLETGTFRRLGSEGSIRVDVRILAATHRDLESRVREGTFRQDLYYRLNVLSIAAPPLRERIEDLPLLVEHFLARLCPGCAPAVDPEAMALLRSYPWPGNVRELSNVIERAVILAEGGIIRPENLPSSLAGQRPPWEVGSSHSPPSLQEMEQRYLATLLDRYNGHRGQVAAALGISERTLYRKLHFLRDEDRRQN